MKELLPIGSVVMLKGGNKRVMICGRIQTHVETGKTYDYCACYYPEGIINPRELFLSTTKISTRCILLVCRMSRSSGSGALSKRNLRNWKRKRTKAKTTVLKIEN